MYGTNERCYLGHAIVRIEPPLYEWSHYCSTCQAMVMTATEMQFSMAQPREEGVIGRVCALPLKEPLRIEWTDR